MELQRDAVLDGFAVGLRKASSTIQLSTIFTTSPAVESDSGISLYSLFSLSVLPILVGVVGLVVKYFRSKHTPVDEELGGRNATNSSIYITDLIYTTNSKQVYSNILYPIIFTFLFYCSKSCLLLSSFRLHTFSSYSIHPTSPTHSLFFKALTTILRMLQSAVRRGAYTMEEEVSTRRTVIVYDVGQIVGRVFCGCTSLNPLGECFSYKVKGVYSEKGANVTLYPARVPTAEDQCTTISTIQCKTQDGKNAKNFFA